MKRSTQNRAKLVVHRETLRTLANLELARVVGGVPAQGGDTGRDVCVAEQADIRLLGG